MPTLGLDYKWFSIGKIGIGSLIGYGRSVQWYYRGYGLKVFQKPVNERFDNDEEQMYSAKIATHSFWTLVYLRFIHKTAGNHKR